MVLFIILLILVAIAVAIALIASFVYWFDFGRSSSGSYISFSKFIELYNLSPEHWDLCDDYVKFRRGTWDYDKYCFKYLDFCKYYLWNMAKDMKENEERKKENKRRVENRIKNIENIIKGNKE